MEAKDIWRWIYVISGLVAGVAGVLNFYNPYLRWGLTTIGFLVGLFFMDTEDFTNLGMRFLMLSAEGFVDFIFPFGGILGRFFSGFKIFLGPVVVANLILWFWKHNILELKLPPLMKRI